MKSLTRVEAIPYDCIEQSLNWSWESFPEWLDELDGRPKGVNTLAYVPLNPMLIYVMGLEGAKAGREPTETEMTELKRLLNEAMDAGACGWSAQRSQPGSGVDMQRDWDGTHFATDLMSHKTAMALAEVLGEHEHAFMQTLLFGPDPLQSFKELEELAEISDSPILFNTVATDERQPDAHKMMLDWIRNCQERSLKIYAQCLTTAQPFFFTFERWNLFDDSDAWRECLLGDKAERLAKFSDPARREELKKDLPVAFELDRMIVLKTFSEKFLPAKGMMLRDGLRHMPEYDNTVDLLVDMVVADGLDTLFQMDQFNSRPELQADLVTSDYGIWGVSDGGAHTKFVTHGAFPTESIIDFVRTRKLVTLEEAHWRLSALPAHLAGFKNRGTITEGAPADIIVYDYENLTLLDEETSYDLPAGEWRLTRKATGYKYTLVNGVTTFVDGECTGNTPGMLLRHGGDAVTTIQPTPLELMTSPLYAEYTLWLNDEAELLDRHRYPDWLELLAPDLRYTMPGRTDGPDGLPENASRHIDETYASMTTRIRRISGATNFAETPRTRTRRFVTNIRLSAESTPDRVVGSSYLLLTRSRGLGADLELLPCERRDELVRIDGRLLLRRREVLVDQATLGLVHLATPL